uniref:uncharacterized protein hmgxb4b isoform X2 n=1 Tax=Monopterus albus TaxID=43700 RepID=UPI0009B329DA|nr:uncharacterized protein LOC109958417 isoform X2 [Monopterus albus]
MDGDTGLVRNSQRETSARYCLMDVEELEEPESDAEEHYKEPECSFNQMGKPSESPEPVGAETSGFLSACTVCVSQDRWSETGEEEDIQNNLLHSCCTAEGSTDQADQSSTLEYSFYLDEQHKTSDWSLIRPVTPVTHRPCLFIPGPSSMTATASTVSSVVNPAVPITSMFTPTGSAWDPLRSTSRSAGCSDGDPVSAAAHLHLLGESLSLIGHHLQETNASVPHTSHDPGWLLLLLNTTQTFIYIGCRMCVRSMAFPQHATVRLFLFTL